MNILWIRGAGKWRFERKSLPPVQKNPVLGVPDGLAAMSTVTSLAPGTHCVQKRNKTHTLSTGRWLPGRGWFFFDQPRPEDVDQRHFKWHLGGRGLVARNPSNAASFLNENKPLKLRSLNLFIVQVVAEAFQLHFLRQK